MPTPEAFLEAILHSPAEDAPRLIYADWLEEHGQANRAEFIRVQCELATLPEGQPRRQQLEERSKAFLDRHEADWSRGVPGRVSFWRGFVEAIGVTSAEPFFQTATTLFRSHPLRHLEMTYLVGHAREWLPLLGRCPEIVRLSTIDLSFGVYEVSDSEFHVLAGLPIVLERLNTISVVEDPITPAGITPLLMSPHLLQLRHLHLCECELHGECGVRPLVESPQLTALQSLSLDESELGPQGTQLLVGSSNCRYLENLDLRRCRLGDGGAQAIARSPQLGCLKSLELRENNITDAGLVALLRSRHLETLQYLWLSYNRITDRGARWLAESPLSYHLKGLVITENQLTAVGVQTLKKRFGAGVSCERASKS